MNQMKRQKEGWEKLQDAFYRMFNRAFFTVRNIPSFWSTILCEAWDNTMRKALGIRLLMEPGGQIRAEITAFTSLK